MSVTTPCLENISSETLSAWGDGGLPEAEAARLRAHVEGCPACQGRLRAYSDIRRLMSGQRIPPAPPVDIAAVRAGQRRQGAMVHMGKRHAARRALWGGMGAALAAALLIAAFSQVFAQLNHVTPTATVTPAGTVTPTTTRLAWALRTLPPGISGNAIAISPVNSDEVWTCQVRGDGYITISWSNDQARTWGLLSELKPPATPSPINGCYPIPDQVSPNTLALGLAWGDGKAGIQGMVSYISSDGGRTWSKLGEVATPALATLGKRTYIIMSYRQSGKVPPTRLMVSDDGLRTWRDITPQSADTPFIFLWPDPATGNLLLGAGPNPNANVLWRTNDGGATWTQITLTNDAQVEYGAWLPAARHWRICGVIDNSDPFLLRCTDDLAKTWSSYAPVTALVTCANCNTNSGGAPVVVQDSCLPERTMALDGSLLMACLPAGRVAKNQALTPDIYRLEPGATTWRLLGPAPGPAGTPSSLKIGSLVVTGDHSSSAGALWYIDPAANILAVAALPA
ncbi:MAG TPA: zf-HC2 domain-containing protein [Ktedonobacterales bacterium]|nr:zf-HC2 domain-containing protein [Ktedonobacterales bacterium]